MPAANQLATDALFTQYLHVVNRALGEHRNEAPYEQILDASSKLLDDTTFAVGIYKDRMDQPHDWFTVELDDGKLSLEEHGRGDSDMTVKVKQAHLEEVVENPRVYIDNPIQLDLDWLKKTVGLQN